MARSTLIKLAGVLTVALVIILDLVLHGHFDDGKIRDIVTESVSTDASAPSLIDFDAKVHDRTAFIEGKVDTQQERQAATEAALRAPGILTLVNDVKVDLIDEPLLQAIKAAQEKDGTPGEFTYRVHDDGHTVTLDGWLPKGMEDMKEALGKMVERVPGVRRVINNINIGEPGGDIEAMILNILRAKNIYFDYDQDTIRDDSLVSIEKIAGVLKAYPDAKVRIEGHTDSIAREEYNKDLSQRRANAVRDALVRVGIDAARLETVGKGESELLVAPDDTPEKRAENRRVVFRINPADFAGSAATSQQANR